MEIVIAVLLSITLNTEDGAFTYTDTGQSSVMTSSECLTQARDINSQTGPEFPFVLVCVPDLNSPVIKADEPGV